MAARFDPLLGQIRKKDIIPQYDDDPVSPRSQSAWVKRTFQSSGGDAGEAFGFLAFTKPGNVTTTYEFKYRTKEGTTVAVALT